MLAKMFSVGCGMDISSNAKDPRNLGSDAAGAAKLREKVLSAWTS